MTAKHKPVIDTDDIMAAMAKPGQPASIGRGPELPSTPMPAAKPTAPRKGRKAKTEKAAPEPEKGEGIKAATRGTTLYLLPEESVRLRHLALDSGRSLHDLILDGVDMLLERRKQPKIKRYSER